MDSEGILCVLSYFEESGAWSGMEERWFLGANGGWEVGQQRWEKITGGREGDNEVVGARAKVSMLRDPGSDV